MSKKSLQLGFCLLVLAAILGVPTLSTASTPSPDPSPGYSRTGVGGTMEQACANAIQNLKDDCGVIAPPTTDPGRCLPIRNLEGQIIGYACTCEATTLVCLGQ